MFDADGMATKCKTDLELHEGMEFESKEEAFSCYKQYAKSIGFAAIIKASRRSRISGNLLMQNLSAPDMGTSKNQVRQKLKACMHVKRRQDGMWIIRSFIKEHNHGIFADQAYYFPGHRNIDLGISKLDTSHATRAS